MSDASEAAPAEDSGVFERGEDEPARDETPHGVTNPDPEAVDFTADAPAAVEGPSVEQMRAMDADEIAEVVGDTAGTLADNSEPEAEAEAEPTPAPAAESTAPSVGPNVIQDVGTSQD